MLEEEKVGENSDAGEDESIDISSDDESAGKRKKKKGRKKTGARLLDTAYNGLLPVSLLAALIGMILGPIPSVICILIVGKTFYPLFIAAPLLIYVFSALLKGGRDIRAIVITAVFSLAGAYLTAVSCEATYIAIEQRAFVLQIPLLIAMNLGSVDILPAFASAYIYPLIFTALGVVVAAQLLKGRAKPPEPESEIQNMEIEDEDLYPQEEDDDQYPQEANDDQYPQEEDAEPPPEEDIESSVETTDD